MGARPWKEDVCATVHLSLSLESFPGSPTSVLSGTAMVSLVLVLFSVHAQGDHVLKFHPQIWTQMIAYICMYNQLRDLVWFLLVRRGMFTPGLISKAGNRCSPGHPQGH